MNATARAAVDETPIPYENGQPVSTCVTTDEAGDWRTAWCRDGGRVKELFGPAYSLRDALDAAARLNERSGLA